MKIKINSLYITLFVISSIVISNQIALIQLFSYQQWYHFASVIISMAMIGFGVSGLIIPILKNKFKDNPDVVVNWILVFGSVSSTLSLLINQKIIGSFDSFLIFFDVGEAIKFLIVIINFTLNFTLLALVIGIFFSYYSDLINKLYFWNLSGSAFGGLVVIILLWFLLPQQILVLNGLLISIIVLLQVSKSYSKNLFLKLFIFASLILNFVFLIVPIELKPSQFKSISRFKNYPDSKIEYQKNSPYGLIEKVSSKIFRASPGLSLNYTGEIPQVNFILINGEVAGYELKSSLNTDYSFLESSTLYLPFYLREFKDVLILNASGGIEVFRSLNGNVQSVNVTELNPVLMEFIKNQFDDLKHPEIKFHKTDPRLFIESSNQKFDLIYYPVTETAGITSGLFAIQEKFLLTKESFQKIYERLNNDGYFSISCYIDNPPRTFLKILNLFLSINSLSGQHLLKNQLIAINNWNTITFILKKGKFDEREIHSVKNFCQNNQFDFFINPESKTITSEYNSVIDKHAMELVSSLINGESENLKNYLFNLSVPDDNKPYFSNFIKPGNFKFYLDQLSLRSLTYSELGYFLIWISFFFIVILSVTLLVSGFRIIQIQTFLKLDILFYFGLIGLAYMIVELSLIQKFTLIFSADVLSITFVITVLLISSGLGSLFSSKLIEAKSTQILICVLIFLFGFSLIIFFNTSIKFLLSLSSSLKFIVSAILIFPLGFMMGMPFPFGIKLFSNFDNKSVPFAWAVNGSFSVLGSLGAILLLLNFGYSTTSLIALILYLFSGWLFLKTKQKLV